MVILPYTFFFTGWFVPGERIIDHLLPYEQQSTLTKTLVIVLGAGMIVLGALSFVLHLDKEKKEEKL